MNERVRIRLILLVITLCVLASLGFARFSFGAILPFMKDGLQMNYQQTGFVASGIFLGYLISSFVSGYFVLKFSAKRTIIFSLILVVLAMTIISFSHQLGAAMLGSLLLGIGSGGANISALGLIPRWFAPKHRGMAMGIANSGSGIGIFFSGIVVPLLISIHPEIGWRYSWWILAILVVIIILLNVFFLKNDPKEVGMQPLGHQYTMLNNDNNSPSTVLNYSSVYKNKNVWAIGVCYLAWGFSYLIFSTFLVDYLMSDINFEKEKAGHFFAIAGFCSIFSGFIWGGISDRFGRISTLAFVFLFQSIVLGSIIYTEHSALILIEVILYGLSLWAVPTITSVSISEIVDPVLIPIAMGFLTLFFGVGQFISPIITGVLIETTKNYLSSFLVSATVVLVASVLSLLLHINNKRRISTMAKHEELQS